MFKIKLALKYMIRKPISWLAVLAVAVSVFIAVVVMTVMHGLVVDFTQKNHRLVGDCVVFTDSLVGFPYYEDFIEELRSQNEIASACPAVINMALLSLKGLESSVGVNLMGIDAASYCESTGFCDTLYQKIDRPEDLFTHSFSQTTPGCIRGICMMNRADHRGEYTHSLDYPVKINLSCFPLSYKGTLLKAGADVVNTKTFFVSNDSNTGLAKVDARTIYIDIATAQELCGMGGSEPRISAVFIKFKSEKSLQTNVDKVRESWNAYSANLQEGPFAQLIQNVKVQDWRTYRRESIAPMEKEQTMLIALFVLIGIVTVFIIFVVFFMIVSHKRKDIGILKSFGISVLDLTNVFLSHSLLIGSAGAAIGAGSGWAFIRNANAIENWMYARFGWQVWDRTIYSIGALPDDVKPEVVTTIVVCALLACVAGALVPSLKASRQRPVDILQVDQL